MKTVACLGAAILISSLTAASAQTPNASPTCNCTNVEANIARQKAMQCRAELQARGLRGDDLYNYISVCVEEARLACVKRAATERIRVQMRRQYLAACMGA